MTGKRIRALSMGELVAVLKELPRLAVEVAETDPNTAAAILDAGDLVLIEMQTRAFGGDDEARAYAEKCQRERAGN